MQPLIYFSGGITLLIVLIVALICIIVLRDRRELKTKQISADLTQLETVVRDMGKIRDELAPALAAFKKNEVTLSQIEGQLRQIGAALNSLEHKPQPVGTIRERQDDRRDRDRGQKQSGKGKNWPANRTDNKRRELPGAGDKEESVTINDGEKYAKVSELAAHGLTAQEIAKRLNVGQEEVSLVLELKGKKPI